MQVGKTAQVHEYISQGVLLIQELILLQHQSGFKRS